MAKASTESTQNKAINFSSPFLRSHLITYIGNKRRLLPFINKGIEYIQKSLGKKKLCVFDGFSGSGVVARLLKYYATEVYINDLEAYSHILNKCYLSNISEIDIQYIRSTIEILHNFIDTQRYEGFISNTYAPKNDADIKEGERAFYTKENAIILDTLKRAIYTTIPQEKQHFFLAPLIVSASIHTNTSGVFKGFHKNNGIGCFGGHARNALKRILSRIEIAMPIFSEMECPVHVYKEDIATLVTQNTLPEFDIAYYDPPYNQHPYGSNYFMLNIIATNKEKIPIQEGVSGIAKEWNRSLYNKRGEAVKAMDSLLHNTSAKYIMLSYNNEGIIPYATLHSIACTYGKVSVLEQEYATYRGSRNLRSRNIRVKELLWIIQKY